jgi:hypothetical protein
MEYPICQDGTLKWEPGVLSLHDHGINVQEDIARYMSYLDHEIQEENVEPLSKQQLDRIRYTGLLDENITNGYIPAALPPPYPAS